MDESLIDGSNEFNILDESDILGDTPTPSQQLAQDLLNELQVIAENNENINQDIKEDSSLENEVNEVETIDYTQQLSDIYNAVNILHTDYSDLSQSLDSIETSIENTPQNIESQFDDFISFGYLVLSLNIGFLVAILFFMGLKK